MREHARRTILILLASVASSSCSRIQRIDADDYVQKMPFVATVCDLEILPLNPRQQYHSAAGPGFRIVLQEEDGERFELRTPVTDANWQWAHALQRLQVGAKYRFLGPVQIVPAGAGAGSSPAAALQAAIRSWRGQRNRNDFLLIVSAIPKGTPGDTVVRDYLGEPIRKQHMHASNMPTEWYYIIGPPPNGSTCTVFLSRVDGSFLSGRDKRDDLPPGR